MVCKIYYSFLLFLIVALITGCDSPTSDIGMEEKSQFVVFSNSESSTDSQINNLIEANLLQEIQINFQYKNKIKGFSADISDQQAERISAKEYEGVEVIPGQFIIIFVDPFDGEKFLTEEGNKWAMETIEEIQNKYDISDKKVLHRYGYAIYGFAAQLSDEQLFELDSEELISYIEPDAIFNLN